LIVGVGADVSNVRVGQADDLPGIAGIAEDFLVTGEAGIENNFTAAPRLRAGGTAVKDPPVFQCESGGAYGYLRQWALRRPYGAKKALAKINFSTLRSFGRNVGRG
jgi:hypothetical protein